MASQDTGYVGEKQMKLIQHVARFLGAVIEQRRQEKMKETMEVIDTDTPKVMQRGRGDPRKTPLKITHIIKDSKGDPICELCRGAIVEVNQRGTKACFNCGAKVEGT